MYVSKFALDDHSVLLYEFMHNFWHIYGWRYLIHINNNVNKNFFMEIKRDQESNQIHIIDKNTMLTLLEIEEIAIEGSNI